MKFYISTSGSEESRRFLAVALSALFSVSEVGIGSAGLDRLPGYQSRMEMLIRQADSFIAILDKNYGIVDPDQTQSIAEQEYHIAVESNLPCLVFIQADARNGADERQKAFIEHIEERHVISPFKDESDLEAKVKLGVSNLHKTAPRRTSILPPISSFVGSITGKRAEPTEDETFDANVKRALNLVETDLEQLVRRAIEFHEAQRRIEKGGDGANDGMIRVTPLWGEPESRSQFLSDIFMVMPFRERYNAIYQDLIVPTVSDLNLTIKRGDEFSSTRGSIMQEVWAALNNCRVVIAETTEINANVYYELGVAHTLGKPAILLTQTTEVEQLPFDIRHLRFIVYSDTPEGLIKLSADLKKSIIWLLNDLEEQQ